MRVAGLAQVEGIPGLENIDVTTLVNGHMAYRAAMPRLLREVGWEVESDEFTEIEDPDPENHEKRQRELIQELDEARKDAETKPEKRRFGFFKRGKLAEKRGWETYDDKMREGAPHNAQGADRALSNVLFDIEAIKAELASEQIEVKQLESTLPPMQLNLIGTAVSTNTSLPNFRPSLRETQSYDASTAFGPDVNVHSSESLPVGRPPNSFNHHLREHHVYGESYSCHSSTLSFKSSFDNHRRSPSPARPSQSPNRLLQQSSATTPPSYPPTPAWRSSPTMPAPANKPSLEHNAWLDEEDEDFGKEKQVTMSFA